jgi:SAM-dependent MidA family methyltransferase
MSPLAEILRDEILRAGTISFHRFMEAALYHPQFGYYCRRPGIYDASTPTGPPPRDPFGMHGDFFTAEQLQPVFGILIAERMRQLRAHWGDPRDFTIVELGAGRGEMAEAFCEFQYVPLEVAAGDGNLPERFCGVVFSNEFFDALPVDVLVMRGGKSKELRVGFEDGRFTWVETGSVQDEVECYRKKYLGLLTEGQVIEVSLEALRWLERIAVSLEFGCLLTIDYGYTSSELPRFPRGTLMSYRSHQAIENVLDDPGGQDITAHVCFTALEEHGKDLGLRPELFETLGRMLLRAGESDQFACALRADSPREEMRRRMQLKQLLYGLGETFRTLLQTKEKG